MDNRPMPVLRWGLLAVALVMCAWFALGAIQTRDQDRAAALINTFVSPSPAVTEHILGLLDTAGTLNPDRNIDFLHKVLNVFDKCRREDGMASFSMGDVGQMSEESAAALFNGEQK